MAEKDTETGSGKLLNTAQAARHLGVTKRAITRLRKEDKLTGVLGTWGRWYYHPDDLTAVITGVPPAPASRNEASPTPEPPKQGVPPAPNMNELMSEVMNEQRPPQEPEDVVTEQAPIIRMANAILVLAIESGASDIHIEPDSRNVRIRCRIDGIMHEIMKLPNYVKGPTIRRFKIMSEMNPFEERLPQAGLIRIKHGGVDYDIRVSTLSTSYGENVTLHILRKSDIYLGLNKLGFAPEVQAGVENLLLASPFGLVLLAGPSGSGITTTAYSLLVKLNSVEKKIVTLEARPEYNLPGLAQSYYSYPARSSFSETLRLLPLMDVDTLFMGDINAPEAMSGAVEVALSGKHIIATMAAQDACMALWRLSQMGLFAEKKPDRAQLQSLMGGYPVYPDKPGLPLHQALLGIVSQRLVRRICTNCKEPYTAPASVLSQFGFLFDKPDETVTLFRGKGCDICRESGYKSRVGIFELMTVNWEIAALVALRAPLADIKDAAKANGMKPMREDALGKILSGQTTPEEVTRVLGRSQNIGR